MKISELPQEIKEKALGYAVQKTDDLLAAFKWRDTKEGHDFWEYWYEKKPTPILDELMIYAESTENAYLLNKLKELQNAGEI